MQTLLIVAGFLWTLIYVLILNFLIKAKKLYLPIIFIIINLSWEILYVCIGLIYNKYSSLTILTITWLILDLSILSVFIKNKNVIYKVKLVLMITLCTIIQYFLLKYFQKNISLQIALLQLIGMSCYFFYESIVKTYDKYLRIVILTTLRLLSTLIYTWYFSFIEPVSGILFLGTLSIILDILSLYFVSTKQNNMLLSSYEYK